MNNKYSKIIMDGNNLFYRSFFVNKDKNINISNKSIESGAIQGFLKSYDKIEREFSLENSEIYVLWDNMSSKINARKQIDPDYKIDRKILSSDFYNSIDYLQLILLNRSNKYYSVKMEGMEADDLVPSLLSSFNKYDRILLFSKDLDWSRCISKNVHWLQHNEIVTEEKFKEKFGFLPTKEKIVLYKSIRGDTSDNIPKGVKGISEKDIMYLINTYQDIYDLLDNIHKEKEIIGQKYIDQFIQNKSRLILNYQLVDFINIDYNELKEYVYQGQFNSKSLRFYYKTLGLQVSEVDKRLLGSFPDKEEIKESNDFFQYQSIQRK
jgi:5'-3' exonuclease